MAFFASSKVFVWAPTSIRADPVSYTHLDVYKRQAVIIPPAREKKVLRMVILISMALSFLFTLIPVLKDISSGFKIIILTFIVAGAAAYLFPVKEEE